MDVKTAYMPGLPSFALKVSTGFFDNPERGLPSLSGMMALLSAETGRVEAVLLDNGYLTDVRTALAGAIAADRLARPMPGGRHHRHRPAGAAAARGAAARPADRAGAALGPRCRQGRSAGARAGSQQSACRSHRRRPSEVVGRPMSSSPRPPARAARDPGRLAASGAAHHRHGLGRAGQAGARSLEPRPCRPRRRRPPEPVRAPGRAPERPCRGHRVAEQPIDELGEIVAGIKPGRTRPARSLSAISPAPGAGHGNRHPCGAHRLGAISGAARRSRMQQGDPNHP